METVYHKMNNWSIYFVNNVLVVYDNPDPGNPTLVVFVPDEFIVW